MFITCYKVLYIKIREMDTVKYNWNLPELERMTIILHTDFKIASEVYIPPPSCYRDLPRSVLIKFYVRFPMTSQFNTLSSSIFSVCQKL